MTWWIREWIHGTEEGGEKGTDSLSLHPKDGAAGEGPPLHTSLFIVHLSHGFRGRAFHCEFHALKIVFQYRHPLARTRQRKVLT